MVRNLFYNVMMVTITIMMVVVQNVRYNKDINVEVVLLIILIHVSSINLPKQHFFRQDRYGMQERW